MYKNYHFENVIIYYYYHKSDPKINGSIIDAIEYFLTIYEKNKDIKLILLDSSEMHKLFLNNFIRKRYNLNKKHKGFLENILVLDLKDIKLKKIRTAAIFDYYTIRKIYHNGFMFFDNLNIIVEDGSEKVFKFANFYSEYPELFPVENYKFYQLKMRLDLIKEPKLIKENIYVSHPINPEFPSTDEYRKEHFELIKFLDKNFKKYFFKTPFPVDNIFEEFDTYLYYKSIDWFDTHPRLFTECVYFDKKILYMNKSNTLDASWLRYKDAIENGYKHRLLTYDDEIISKFLG